MNTAPKHLADLWATDKIRSNASHVERVNNVDVITTAEGENIPFCHIPYMMPFSFVWNNTRWPYDFLSIKGSMAALLAAQHLNAGDGSIVSEVEGLDKKCDIKFTIELFDTELSESKGVDEIVKILSRSPGEQMPCAFMGNSASSVTMATSLISGIEGYPQLSPASTSSLLDEKTQYRLFARLNPSGDSVAVTVILFLSQQLNVSHLGVIHGNNAYATSYAQSLSKAVKDYAPHMTIRAFPEVGDIQESVKLLKSTQYRYFFGVLDEYSYYVLMEEAYRQGIAGTGEHNWMFSDGLNADTIIGGEFDKDSPLHLASRGVSVLTDGGGLPGRPVYDKFLQEWQGLNNDKDKEYILSKHPKYPAPGDRIHEYLPNKDYLLRGMNNDNFFTTLGSYTPVVYDSIIALGLSACNVSQPNSYFDGWTHFGQILNTQFEGASGQIVLDKSTGSRDPRSAFFQNN
mmetsp:Transcript_46416/g.70058  ORF Transcript_46416/g.70058 Transcript_46416/m.70058 type:complete len:458 (+) Transcript_46416:138-1511(+)